MQQPKLTTSQVDQAIKDYSAGANLTNLAESLGVHSATILYHIKKAGITPRGKTGRPKVHSSPEGFYVCSCCKETLPADRFGPNSTKNLSRPVAYRCRVCHAKEVALKRSKANIVNEQ